MDLPEQYERQDRWRRWDHALSMVPLKPGQRVLDLGCGVGQNAARMHRLGATVVGVDRDASLLEYARTRHPDLRFVHGELRDVNHETFGAVDGIWASFVAAYFSDFPAMLAQWSECLSPGGWVALVEVDDMLGHDPIAAPVHQQIEQFYAATRGYDFNSGRKLATAATRAGLAIEREANLHDDELSFDGPAAPDVLEAWEHRFARMSGLRSHFGTRAHEVERALLDSLRSTEHRSRAKVMLVVATARRHRRTSAN